MRLSGQLLKVEPVSGTNDDGSSYSYVKLHVLDLDSDRPTIVPLRISDRFNGEIPSAGEYVDLLVSARAYAGRSGPALAFTALGDAALVSAAA